MGNPGIWWGIVGLAIPILLHFWHQKRGKELPWAATRWLKEVALQRSRGLRLEDLLLLLLRCILLLSLLLYLSRPFWRLPGEVRVHWVQPDPKVVEAFRFELEEARRKGETVQWWGGEQAEDLQRLPLSQNLQSGLNAWTRTAEHLLYLRNDLSFSEIRPVFVPGPFTLHNYKDSSERKAEPRPSSIQVFIEGENKAVRAALESLKEVNGLSYTVDTLLNTEKKYDIKFLVSPDHSPDLQVITGAWKAPKEKEVSKKNVIYLPTALTAKESDLVFEGRLPQWIAEQLEQRPPIRLTEAEIQAIFKVRKNTAIPYEARYLWVFLVLLAVERWWSIRKNA